MQKHPNLWHNFHRENTGLLWEIGRYVCSPGASQKYRQNLLFRIHLIVVIIIYYYYDYYYLNILLCPTKQKENRKKIAALSNVLK